MEMKGEDKREVRELHSSNGEVRWVKWSRLHAFPVSLSSLLCRRTHGRNERGGTSLPPAAGGAIEQSMTRVGDPGAGRVRRSTEKQVSGRKVCGRREVNRRKDSVFVFMMQSETKQQREKKKTFLFFILFCF